MNEEKKPYATPAWRLWQTRQRQQWMDERTPYYNLVRALPTDTEEVKQLRTALSDMLGRSYALLDELNHYENIIRLTQPGNEWAHENPVDILDQHMVAVGDMTADEYLAARRKEDT